jgi:hypothetical protein
MKETGYMEIRRGKKLGVWQPKMHSGMFVEVYGKSTDTPSDTARRKEKLRTKRRQQNKL